LIDLPALKALCKKMNSLSQIDPPQTSAMTPTRIAIIGTVGVPANYGGFETLVENLLRHHQATDAPETLTVYCSDKAYEARQARFLEADLVYIPLKANGAQSIPYDMWSLLSAVRRGVDVILLLGVSGALILPLLRRITKARIVTNIDGIEWKRDKWGTAQRKLLRTSEAMAVRHSHQVIADNGAIADYVRETYGTDCSVIAYGGDHALAADSAPVTEVTLPERYAFNVCRIEPENNVHMLLEAFADSADFPLIAVGNWDRSDYGLELKRRYADAPGLRILDPIYDIGKLRTLRAGASAYLHGHSAGGTNPSLVEMMHFAIPVFAYDCTFNRHTTEDRALFFSSADELKRLVRDTPADVLETVGQDMLRIARARYTWEAVGAAYFDLLRRA
jgi:glycosyltransferase involved in cell wall biosynthesis